MESISQKLISARESLGFSIEQIARETNIAKSYLTALENEDFEAFPGETYLLGFLRNYSEFLGLNPDEMINLYKNMMIQEQPAPMEELFDTRKSLPKTAVIIILAVVVLSLAAAGYFYIYPNYISNRPVSEVEKIEKEKVETEVPARLNIKNTYEFADEVLEKRFKKNDAISIKFTDDSHLIVIADIAESVTFVHPQGELLMNAGEEALLDLDGDSAADVRMLLRSLDADNNSIVLHIDRFVQSAAPGISERVENTSEEDAPVVVESGTMVPGSGQPGVPSRAIDPFVVREADSIEAFTLNIIFRGYCLLRYEADSSIREERYFHKSETFRLDVSSKVKLWASNAGALSAKINGVDIDLGGSGEISARIVQWVYNSESTKYELQLIPAY